MLKITHVWKLVCIWVEVLAHLNVRWVWSGDNYGQQQLCDEANEACHRPVAESHARPIRFLQWYIRLKGWEARFSIPFRSG
jgi:hypothetical protein